MKGFGCKQFFICHENSAMKVGTDSLLLGSWSQANQLAKGRILDIGCGSGILSLMLAQKTNEQVAISAIDIDAGACQDSQFNFLNSPFKNRLSVTKANLLEYTEQSAFDWIITNPPYFSQGLLAAGTRRLARQQSQLNWNTLFKHSRRLLGSNGKMELICPAAEIDFVYDAAAGNQFKLAKKLTVYSQENAAQALRYCLLFDFNTSEAHIDSLAIYTNDKTYSDEYRRLCRHYYLNF